MTHMIQFASYSHYWMKEQMAHLKNPQFSPITQIEIRVNLSNLLPFSVNPQIAKLFGP